jgi:hypothetical protein
VQRFRSFREYRSAAKSGTGTLRIDAAFAGFVRGQAKDRSGLLDLTFWERAGGAATWSEMHRAETALDQVMLLRRCTNAGRTFGGDEFVNWLEQHFQRSWRRLKNEPPRPGI